MTSHAPDTSKDISRINVEAAGQKTTDYGDLSQYQLPGQQAQSQFSRNPGQSSPKRSAKGVSPTVASAQADVQEKGLDGLHLRAAAQNGLVDRLSLADLKVAKEVAPLSTGATHIDRHYVNETVAAMQGKKQTVGTEKEDKTEKSPRALAKGKSSKNSIRAHLS